MIVYAETNFVLELALLQEDAEACEALLGLCNAEVVRLVIPAFCMIEPYETLIRRHKRRLELRTEVSTELDQLVRTRSYQEQSRAIDDVKRLLEQSTKDERSRLDETVAQLLSLADVIPIEQETLASAPSYQRQHDLSPPDAIVLSSVVSHLKNQSPEVSCFLNKNSKDFKDPDIKAMLEQFGCKLIFSFSHGVRYIQSRKPATDDT